MACGDASRRRLNHTSEAMLYNLRLSDLPPWLYGVIVPVLGLVELLLFRWIFSLDDDPSRRQGVDYIRPKPIARVIEVILMMASALVFVSALYRYPQNLEESVGLGVFGLVFGLIAGFVSNTHLWLDDEGMHYRAGVGKVQFISYKNFDHYEIQRVALGSNGTTTYYHFISNDDTNLSISRSTYDIDDLLEKIRTHTVIREKPYKARTWFND
jgi:hypothetical protein